MIEWDSKLAPWDVLYVGPKQGKLKFPNTVRYVFDTKDDKEIFNDKLVAYVEQPLDHPTQCLYGINSDCKISWELNKDNYLNLKYAFRQPFLDKDKKLWIVNLGGKQYQVDPTTGKVLDTRFEDFDFDIEEGTIIIKGKKHQLPEKICEVFPFKDTLLAMTEFKDNIYGFDLKGELRWDLNFVNKDSEAMYQGRVFSREIINVGQIYFNDKDDMELKIRGGETRITVDHVSGKILKDEQYK